MKIQLTHVIPEYLEKEKVSSSEVWNQDLTFEGNTHVVAPSGRGKTSLIHFIYGLRKDYSGGIVVNNKEINEFTSEEYAIARSGQISIVFQDLRLFPDHTALENIRIKRALKPYGEDRINEMSELLGIHNKLHQLCRHCSYGEQQRIAIIRALQQPFEFLILDEPFSHLDDNNAQKAMKLIISETSIRNASVLLTDLQRVPFFPADTFYQL